MGQMRGDNRQLGRQVLGVLGDTIVALIVGVLCLFILGGIIGAIWNLIA
jgi:hypothetical protein